MLNLLPTTSGPIGTAHNVAAAVPERKPEPPPPFPPPREGPLASTAPFDLPSRIVWVKVHLHAVAGGVRVGGGAAVDVTDGSEEVEAEEPGPPDDGVGVACGVVVAPLSEWTAAAVL